MKICVGLHRSHITPSGPVYKSSLYFELNFDRRFRKNIIYMPLKVYSWKLFLYVNPAV